MSDSGKEGEDMTEDLREDSPYEVARKMQQQRFEDREGALVPEKKKDEAPTNLPPEKVGATVVHFATNLRRLLRDNPDKLDELRSRTQKKKGA